MTTKMKYQLSQHAKNVLEARQIKVEWLEQVFGSPEMTEADSLDGALEHRLGKIKEHGNRVLRVVLNKKEKPARIVTVFFDRSLKGKL